MAMTSRDLSCRPPAVVSAPAFEIRWRHADAKRGTPGPDRAGHGGDDGSTRARTPRPLPSRTVTIPATTPPPGLPSASSSAGGSDPSPTAPSRSEAQSTGAVAAIAVGTSLGVLIVVLAAVLWVLGRRLKAGQAAAPLPQGAPLQGAPPLCDGGGTAAPGPEPLPPPAELEHSPMGPSELPAADRPGAPAWRAVFEMDAGPVAAAQPKQQQAN